MDYLYREISESEYRLKEALAALKVLEHALNVIRNDKKPLETFWQSMTLAKGLRRAEELMENEIRRKKDAIGRHKEHIKSVKGWISRYTVGERRRGEDLCTEKSGKD